MMHRGGMKVLEQVKSAEIGGADSESAETHSVTYSVMEISGYVVIACLTLWCLVCFPVVLAILLLLWFIYVHWIAP